MPKPTRDLKPEGKPAAAEFGQFVARLAQRGITGPELAALIHQTQTRRDNARALAAWLRTRPKA